MPYMHFYDGGELDESSGGFEYESAEAHFDFKKLQGTTQLVLNALWRMGATQFRVTYDGGNDEGFAHADAVFFGDTRREPDAVIADLAKSSIPAEIRAAAKADAKGSLANELKYLRDDSDAALTEYLLDDLAHVLASRLLGDGYGTGEYELYGAFMTDLASGNLVDDPDARKPLDMM